MFYLKILKIFHIKKILELWVMSDFKVFKFQKNITISFKVFFVSVLMYSQIALSYLADLFILGIEIDFYSNLGTIIIVGAMIGLVYKEQKQKQ